MPLLILVVVALLTAAPASAQTGPPLVEAVRAGDAQAVAALLDSGTDPDLAAPDGATPLLWAAFRDDRALVARLLATGADPSIANDVGATPLWAAGRNGSAEVTRRLLAAGADADQALLSGETPLMAAASGGFADVAALLLDGGATVDATGVRRQTALMWAAAAGHADVVDVLLDAGADLRARDERWRQMMAVEPHGHVPYNRWIPHGGNTPLLFAVRSGDIATVRRLVEAGADVDDADAWGVTATMLAAHANHTDVAVYLLAQGADPNGVRPGFTALHAAIMHRNETVVRALVERGADVHQRVTQWTPTRRSSDDYSFLPEMVNAPPVWLAARYSTPAIVRLLVEAGADATIVHHGEWMSRSLGSQGQTPQYAETTILMAALGMGGGRAWAPPIPDARALEDQALAIARLAIEAGVDVNAADVDGRTALDAARRAGFDRVADYLLSLGAS